jgi:hypothetical protein
MRTEKLDARRYFHKGKSSIVAATAAGSVAELTQQVSFLLLS